MKNFITEIIDADLKSKKYDGRVHTRFPPEPNGYLHIGHAKAIWINFAIAEQYGGLCNLRLDDTDPTKEETKYAKAIEEDVRWLGFNWQDRFYYASDYFGKFYEYALQLIKKDKAYVDDLSLEQIREYRGTVTTAGEPSPFRCRLVEENLDLFQRMKQGEFAEGARVLRAKIDMASPHMCLRDPIIYRIRKSPAHYRTGNKWCIYPMYDFAHCLEDSIEGITHSLCTLEFRTNRPLYDWFLDQLGVHHPQQIEFARLNLSHTVLSKRKLLELVEQKLVSGWDDPRMPTLRGLRRRGYTAQSIRDFCQRIGLAKFNSIIDIGVLENAIREELNKTAPRVMAVLRPVKVIIDNYPKGKEEKLNCINNPEDPAAGSRSVPFGRELYIERDDFRQSPPKKFYRLAPGREVRLRYAYFIKCTDVVKDKKTGEISEIHCSYDPATKGGDAPDGRKVKATLHWVSAKHAVPCEVRLYEHLFNKENPDDVLEGVDWKTNLNPNSQEVLKNCWVEPSLKNAPAGNRYQFERLGYFCADSVKENLVFNRIVCLRDSWAKIGKKGS